MALPSLSQAPFSKSLSLCGHKAVFNSCGLTSSQGFRCGGESLPPPSVILEGSPEDEFGQPQLKASG